MKYLIPILFLGFACFPTIGFSQKSDTVRVDDVELTEHNPKKATYLSLAVPGLGQIYNKKYWKLPILYAGLGTTLFIAIDQSQRFRNVKNAYVDRINGIPTKYDDIYPNDNQLLELTDIYRRNRDLMFVLSGVIYALNVVDAAVDAHLYYFEVSDDLAASVQPHVQWQANGMMASGLQLRLHLGKSSAHRLKVPLM